MPFAMQISFFRVRRGRAAAARVEKGCGRRSGLAGRRSGVVVSLPLDASQCEIAHRPGLYRSGQVS